MTNKWEICIDVDEDEFELLVAILEYAPRWPFAPVDEINNLKAKIGLAWTEREVEQLVTHVSTGRVTLNRPPLTEVERWASAGGGKEEDNE